jgi:Na+/phosphate symporter
LINIENEVKEFTDKIESELYTAFEYIQETIETEEAEKHINHIDNLETDISQAEEKIEKYVEEDEEYRKELYWDELEAYFYTNIKNS